MAGISETNVLFLAPVWRDGEVREVSGVSPVIKRAAFTRRIPTSPRNACRVAHIAERAFYNWLKRGETAKSGRFLEFLESLKKAGAELYVSNLAVIQQG